MLTLGGRGSVELRLSIDDRPDGRFGSAPSFLLRKPGAEPFVYSTVGSVSGSASGVYGTGGSKFIDSSLVEYSLGGSLGTWTVTQLLSLFNSGRGRDKDNGGGPDASRVVGNPSIEVEVDVVRSGAARGR